MPSITTAVKRLLWLTSRHLGGEGTGRPFPLSPRVTGNGIQAASRSPPPPGRYRGLLPPPSRGRAVSGDSPDTVHGKETGFYGAFGETDKSLPPTGHRIDGESPPWGRRLDGEGDGTAPAPVSCVSPKTSFHASSRPNPASLSHLPSMPSRKKPHHAAVTRGIPHEDGGSVFIQIPVTPPESVHGVPTERFIKPVRHWFDGLIQADGPAGKQYPVSRQTFNKSES